MSPAAAGAERLVLLECHPLIKGQDSPPSPHLEGKAFLFLISIWQQLLLLTY